MTATADDLATAQTWLHWRDQQSQAPDSAQERGHWTSLSAGHQLLLARLVQACAEQPREMQRRMGDVVPWAISSEGINPLRGAAFDALKNVVSNGVGDDWELFLQWTDTGYRVVAEDQRQLQDARLGAQQVLRLVDIVTGGLRAAPGLADLDALVQDMYESPVAHEDASSRSRAVSGSRHRGG